MKVTAHCQLIISQRDQHLKRQALDPQLLILYSERMRAFQMGAQGTPPKKEIMIRSWGSLSSKEAFVKFQNINSRILDSLYPKPQGFRV